MEKLNEIIKENREKKRISQRELARRINVDNAFISRIEKGIIKKPNIVILTKLSKELDINMYDILEKANYNEEEIKLYNIFNNISFFFDIEGEEKKNNVSIIDKNNNQIISIIKVLEEFKKNNLTLKEALGLLSIQLNINILEYIPQEEIEKNDLNNIFQYNNEKL